MNFPTLSQTVVSHQRVMLRTDLNVPLRNGEVVNAARIEAALPTIRQLLAANAAVMIVSHLGRPVEGEFDPALSLAPVASYLSAALEMPIPLVSEWLGTPVEVQPGQAVLLENTRFYKGEKQNQDELAQKIAALADVYVLDAFSVAHRKQASTHAVMRYAPLCCAGPALIGELSALDKALHQPERPITAIVGGSKISSKLPILKNLLQVVDCLIVGGGIANTFLAAAGYEIGSSLYESELLEETRQLLASAKQNNVDIPLPTDVVVAERLSETAKPSVKSVEAVSTGDMILDIGPRTASQFANDIQRSATILWNGPVGVFEYDQFATGTQTLAQAIAESDAFSIAGGGDTIAAIDAFNVREQINYISTGGGAFLEYLQGETLPGIAMLEQCCQQQEAIER